MTISVHCPFCHKGLVVESEVPDCRWHCSFCARVLTAWVERQAGDSLRGAKAPQKSRSEGVAIGAQVSLQPAGCEGGFVAALRGSEVDRKLACSNGHLWTNKTRIRRANGRLDCRVCVNHRKRQDRARRPV